MARSPADCLRDTGGPWHGRARLRRPARASPRAPERGASFGTRMSASHLVIDAARLAGQFEREPFTVRHRLTAHPLLQLARLIELAAVLPESSVEYNQADLPIEQEYLATPRNGLTIDQTMRQIED